MNILLVYPHCPDSFWNFKHALKFIAKKAAVPPLGLITVSAMLPSGWHKRLVDLNVDRLDPDDLRWADFVFISAMYIQKESVNYLIGECKRFDKPIVAGGPLFTQDYFNYPDIDHFVLNEAELTMPRFLADWQAGTLQRVYASDEFADLSQSPVPDYRLLDRRKYAFMNIQVSRGCPFACSFCEITTLFGNKVRMKPTEQVLRELETLYQLKWRGPVSIVDDNFIGNKHEIKDHLLPAMQHWMHQHHYPFTFNSQTTINIADDPELLQQMIDTGFNSTFIGIETPDELALHNCNKVQNNHRDMLQCVRKIQKTGLQVSAGFIVGFDSDTPSVFQRQVEFIQQSGIVSAMVGLLNAPKNTRLYRQLEAENRLTIEATGSNTDFTMNFVPKMDPAELIAGYKDIIRNIYATKPFYRRLRNFLLNYNRLYRNKSKVNFSLILAFFRAILVIGVLNRGRTEYWKLMVWTMFRRPGSLVEAITYAIYGYHFRMVYGVRE